MNDLTLNKNRSALEQELIAAGARFKGRACTCPFHDDRHESAGVFEGEDGVWRFKCQASSCGWHGDIFDVRAKVSGKPLAEVLNIAPPAAAPARQTPPPRVYPTIAAMVAAVSHCVAHYAYANPDTRAVELVVLRVEPPGEGKRFLQASPWPGGGFAMQAPPKPLPLYNRSRVRASQEVVMVEGEKCVHAMTAVGIVATTTPGGAGKASGCDLSPLAGKRVYLWPDADPPNPLTTKDGKAHPNPGARTGLEHMRDVASRLATLTPPAECFWIDCDTLRLPPKGDAADFLAAMEDTPAEDQALCVRAVMAGALSMGPSGSLAIRYRAIASGEYYAESWKWRKITQGTQALTPGSITILAGDPGSTKSFWLLETMQYWHEAGVPVALFEVEKDRDYHLNRALAQRAQCGELTDLRWCKDNADEVARILAENTSWADSFGTVLYDRKTQGIKLNEMAEWVDRMGAAKKRIIAIDPISLCDAGKDRFIADQDFMGKVEQSVTRHGTSLILVTHPVKGAKGDAALGMTSGGAVYEREADTVIWIQRHDTDQWKRVKPSHLDSPDGHYTHEASFNRTIKLLKTRNGRGNGWNLAYQFHGQSLTFEEIGVVQREEKTTKAQRGQKDTA